MPYKSYDTCVITLWRVHVTSLTTICFLIEIMLILKAKKIPFLKCHMINMILHSWSFYMKFMKLAEGSFHKFHIKMTTRLRSSINITGYFETTVFEISKVDLSEYVTRKCALQLMRTVTHVSVYSDQAVRYKIFFSY